VQLLAGTGREPSESRGMSKIVIGEAEGKNIGFDLDVLMPSRLLIQADSGGGKSWLLRVLLEQIFGKMQAIAIDPEGEFASLREKFPYVLVGKGGETPADPRSASLLAQRLLELKASAICDLYELKSHLRHTWVKNFLDGLVEAPKNLRTPCLVVVDEAHIFCPEKSESEAHGSMIDLCTRGRKRGLCAVFATQRLAMLDKDASSQLQNRLIGPTFEDVNRKRAAEVLGIAKGADEREFFREIQLLDPGNFFALGRAISRERVLVHVGQVQTAHPKAFEKHAAAPPPTPDKIKALLPKLSDLPQQAEEKARTEAEFKREIRELKQQLRQSQAKVVHSVHPDPQAQKTIHQLQSSANALAKVVRQFRDQKVAELDVDATVRTLHAVLARPFEGIRRMQRQADEVLSRLGFQNPNDTGKAFAKIEPAARDSVRDVQVVVPSRRSQPEPVEFSGNGSDLRGPELKILRAMGELVSIGKIEAPVEMVAAWAGYSPIGGAFGNPRGSLRTRGLIDYPQPGTMALTEAGRSLVGASEPPSPEEIWRRIERTSTGPELKILRALLENAGREEISKEQLDYPRPGMVKAAEWLFALEAA